MKRRTPTPRTKTKRACGTTTENPCSNPRVVRDRRLRTRPPPRRRRRRFARRERRRRRLDRRRRRRRPIPAAARFRRARISAAAAAANPNATPTAAASIAAPAAPTTLAAAAAAPRTALAVSDAAAGALALGGANSGAARAAAIFAAALNAKHAAGAARAAKMEAHFESELEINDFPQQARWKVTHKDSLAQIAEFTGTAITTRGQFYAPGKQAPPGERRLYLLIEGPTERCVKEAKNKIKEIIEQVVAKEALPGDSRPSIRCEGRAPRL